jgi:hypothetical protein
MFSLSILKHKEKQMKMEEGDCIESKKRKFEEDSSKEQEEILLRPREVYFDISPYSNVLRDLSIRMKCGMVSEVSILTGEETSIHSGLPPMKMKEFKKITDIPTIGPSFKFTSIFKEIHIHYNDDDDENNENNINLLSYLKKNDLSESIRQCIFTHIEANVKENIQNEKSRNNRNPGKRDEEKIKLNFSVENVFLEESKYYISNVDGRFGECVLIIINLDDIFSCDCHNYTSESREEIRFIFTDRMNIYHVLPDGSFLPFDKFSTISYSNPDFKYKQDNYYPNNNSLWHMFVENELQAKEDFIFKYNSTLTNRSIYIDYVKKMLPDLSEQEIEQMDLDKVLWAKENYMSNCLDYFEMIKNLARISKPTLAYYFQALLSAENLLVFACNTTVNGQDNVIDNQSLLLKLNGTMNEIICENPDCKFRNKKITIQANDTITESITKCLVCSGESIPFPEVFIRKTRHEDADKKNVGQAVESTVCMVFGSEMKEEFFQFFLTKTTSECYRIYGNANYSLQSDFCDLHLDIEYKNITSNITKFRKIGDEAKESEFKTQLRDYQLQWKHKYIGINKETDAVIIEDSEIAVLRVLDALGWREKLKHFLISKHVSLNHFPLL